MWRLPKTELQPGNLIKKGSETKIGPDNQISNKTFDTTPTNFNFKVI